MGVGADSGWIGPVGADAGGAGAARAADRAGAHRVGRWSGKPR